MLNNSQRRRMGEQQPTRNVPKKLPKEFNRLRLLEQIELANQKKVVALLAPSGRNQIEAALWDDGHDHNTYLKVVLRQLRAVLAKHVPPGTNPLPYLNKKYSLHPCLDVWTDVGVLRQARTSDDITQLRLALGAYEGFFLPEMETDWVMETRQTCLDIALEMAMRLGQRLESQSPREAEAIYRQAIALDALYSPAYEALIRLLNQIGDNALAQMVQRSQEQQLGLN